MFNNLSIMKKMALLIVTSAIFMTVTGFAGYYYLQQTGSMAKTLYDEGLILVKLTNDNRTHQRAVLASLLEIMVTTDAAHKTKLLEEIKTRANQYNENMNTMKKANLDEYEKKAIAEVDELMKKYRDSREAVIALAMQNKNAEAYQVYVKECQPIAEATNKKLREISQCAVKDAEEINKNLQKELKNATIWLAGLNLAALLFSIFLGWTIARAVSRPMAAATGHVGVMAKGDFSMDAPKEFLSRGDEFGIMAQAFDDLAKNMRSVLRQVSQSAEQVAASSEELTAGAQQSADAAGSVAQAVTDVASGTEQAKGAVQTANNLLSDMEKSAATAKSDADLVASLAMKADEQTGKGVETITRAISQMETIGVSAKKVDGAVEKVASGAKKIDEIVSLISGIAAQTNLLALNAAIEAARAGEQGRGFAVVAEEVRKLAEQAGVATTQISGLIQANGHDIGEAVTAVAEANQNIEAGVANVRLAGDQFRTIAEIAREVRERAEKVSHVASDVAQGNRDAMGAAEQIDQVLEGTAAQAQSVSAATEEQSASMEEIAASSQALAKLAQDLQAAVAKFRI